MSYTNGSTPSPARASPSQSTSSKIQQPDTPTHYPIRTVPPYVQSSDWGTEDDPSPSWPVQPNFLGQRPGTALLPMGMYMPFVGRRNNEPGQHNAAETPTQTTAYGSRWTEFMIATGAPPPPKLSNSEREKAESIYAAYDRRREEQDALLSKSIPPPASRGVTFIASVKRTLMKNTFIPLGFRLFVIVMSIIALTLSTLIYKGMSLENTHNPKCRRDAGTWMAVVVGAVAILYTSYIAWDEFSSKPIGLRRPSSKLRLLLLDLVFIVLMGSNVALAFQALTLGRFPCTDHGGCPRDENNRGICNKQVGLSAVLTLTLVAWLTTFIVSLYRLVSTVEVRHGH